MTNETQENTLQFKSAFKPDLAAWVQWKEGGFEVQIKYLSMVDAEKMVKSCYRNEFDSKTHQKKEVLNMEVFERKVSDLILDWKGLTKTVAAKFIAITPETPEGQFPCNSESKAFVIQHFDGFFTWVLDTAKTLHQKQLDEVDEEIKN